MGYPQTIDSISLVSDHRIKTRISEFDRTLGGGLVPGSLLLLGGDPGIGKSTLVLQVAGKLSEQGLQTLYVSGEESPQQIKLRAERLSVHSENLYVVSGTCIEHIFDRMQDLNPDLLIVDSIQTTHTEALPSAPGSVGQLREVSTRLLRWAKESNTPTFLIGHVTKDGAIAGPKVLEHLVDTVLYFEGDSKHMFRIVRAVKNRYGSTNEIGIFEMLSTGLREVANPSEMFVNQHSEDLSGTAIAATVDGMRPFMIETQSLVSSAVYGTPQRSSTGFDIRRLNMLLAVLEKRAGFRLGVKDVFLNIAGGIKVSDPAIDLSVISAILSSNLDISISKKFCFAGETGLSGEIRPVSHIDQRIKEANKLGFEKIFISKYNRKADIGKTNIQIIEIGRVDELVKRLFG